MAATGGGGAGGETRHGRIRFLIFVDNEDDDGRVGVKWTATVLDSTDYAATVTEPIRGEGETAEQAVGRALRAWLKR